MEVIAEVASGRGERHGFEIFGSSFCKRFSGSGN